jgi:hypothetical protein
VIVGSFGTAVVVEPRLVAGGGVCVESSIVTTLLRPEAGVRFHSTAAADLTMRRFGVRQFIAAFPLLPKAFTALTS